MVQVAERVIIFVQLFPPAAEMDKACGSYGGQENCMEPFGGGPKGKRALARPTKKEERKESKRVRRDKVKNIDQ